MPHALHVVDVFAEERYAGNQLAVVLDAGDLPSGTMAAVAREMNFSETTFVLAGAGGEPRGGAGWPVRIFTPSEELPFAGHPTLGTAAVVRDALLGGARRGDRVTLQLGVGAVPVRFEPDGDGDGERAWLEAPPVALRARVAPERLAPALGLDAGDLRADAPVQHVAAGVAFVIAPLATREALARARLDPGAFAPLAAEGLPMMVYCFADAPPGAAHALDARMFFDAHGVREDPATGSATACLGAYLVEHGLRGDGPVSLAVEQGRAMGRPSLLHLRARRREGGGAHVEVGGRVIPVVRGELL